MNISAKIIEDSISPNGKRITTMELCFPRFILSEWNTHRIISKSASSSRAIPSKKLREQVLKAPATPVHWGKNQSGMQAREELGGIKLFFVKSFWNIERYLVCFFSWVYEKLGLHKQLANRCLEKYQMSNVVATSTEWDNFFNLRLHPDSQPEIAELARVMKQALDASTPKKLSHGEYHLPYVNKNERMKYTLEDCIKTSVARCARVSYKTFDNKPSTIEKDRELYDKLTLAVPPHLSPTEHQATPDRKVKTRWEKKAMHGNFDGWIQYRKEVAK